MAYSVKEAFMTLQGEGFHAGRAALFIRFTGCNLWSGLEKDRSTATCSFCDTDFIGTDGLNGGKFQTAKALLEAYDPLWTGDKNHKFCVLTGGEPLLQVDKELIDRLHSHDYEIAVETNGTKPIPDGIEWVCVSPKAGSNLTIFKGNELKLVFPQNEFLPEIFTGLGFDHFYLQPMDGPEKQENTQKAIAYCLKNPQWKLSIQTHKILNIL